MDRLKEILNNIKDRLTNPLIFSFICSWVVINWKIIVALFWYDTDQVEKAGFKTIFDFVSYSINKQNSFIYPLLIALGYTILMPIVKNLIRALYSWASKWGESWNLKILKGGMISIDKYFKFRDDYDKRTKILEEIISKENELTHKYNSLNTTLLETKASENNLRQQLSEKVNEMARVTDARILNGHWTNTFSDTIVSSLGGTEEIIIENGNYYVIDKIGDKKHVFFINNFHFNVTNKTIFFIKEVVGQEKAFIQEGPSVRLRFNPNRLVLEHPNLLVGFENGTTKIKYERQGVESFLREN